ncbi:MAG: ubiquitin-like domain-containing protein, partial [Anaerolineae bacterium]
EGALAPWRPQAGLMALALLLILASTMTAGYLWTGREVTVVLDGQPASVRTHQTTVGTLLEEMGLELQAEDLVQPPVDAPLRGGETVVIQRARPVTIEVDGQVLPRRPPARSVAAILREAQVALSPHDRVTVNGQAWDPESPLPGSLAPVHLLSSQGQESSAPLHIRVQRAVPIYLNDDGVLATIYTTAATVGQALQQEGVIIYLADEMNLDLRTPISPGLHLTIQRSKPVTILADGRAIKTRTREGTVAGVLAQEGVTLSGKDYTVPQLEAPIRDNLTVQVIRVKEEFFIEEEPIPFQTVWRADPELEIDHRRLDQQGEDGVYKRRYRIVYENGREVSRTLEKEWVDREPTTEVIAYGTKIVLREMETPQGPIRYWRKLRVLATSYSAATSGKSRDHPRYGITRLGWEARKGVIAVDPRVINFHTQIYVPGYGIGVAGDTGGRIKGLHIDLGFDEDALELWYRWVDVYLLDPPPPTDQIRWILPGWPRERR